MTPDSSLGFMGAVTPATRMKANELVNWAQANANINVTHVWGYDKNPGNWEHHTGRAIDLMVFGNYKAGDRIAAYVIAHARRLGVEWVIWYQRIYNVSKGYWREMADRGNATENHKDHLHIYFAQGAYVPPLPPLPGSSIPNLPKPSGGGRFLTVDGIFDGPTCRVFQTFLDVKADGIYGPNTIRAKQAWLKVKVDGIDGPTTNRAFNRKVGRPQEGDDWTRESTRGLEEYLNRGIAAGTFKP